MYHSIIDWRQRRNQMNSVNTVMAPYNPSFYPISGYSTDNVKNQTTAPFGAKDNLNKLHMLSDPLKKNLADTIVTSENSMNKMALESVDSPYNRSVINKMSANTTNHRSDFYSSISGITSFFSGVLNVISHSIFNKTTKSQASNDYDYFNDDFNVYNDDSTSFQAWHESNGSDQNKNVRAHDQFRNSSLQILDSDMEDCWVAADQCEDKINKMRLLLTHKSVPRPRQQKRQRKMFVDPKSIEESYEDHFSPEDLVNMPYKNILEYVSPINNHKQELLVADAPRIKTETNVNECMDIVKSISSIDDKIDRICIEEKNVPEILEKSQSVQNSMCSKTDQVISSCEDKLSRLKALLLKRQNKETKTEPVTETVQGCKSNQKQKKTKVKDKRFKNPNRTSRMKRHKCEIKRNLEEDMNFANSIDSDVASSVENSPSIHSNTLIFPCSKEIDIHLNALGNKDYFDEISGRFNSSSVESQDSFQIVFTDDPAMKTTRIRRSSDCESEDSFIVFEDSVDNCYTSNDVFGNDSDSEDDSESESGASDSDVPECPCKLSHNLSRSFNDLTDDSLYNEKRCGDEVDCSLRMCEEIDFNNSNVMETEQTSETGLLMTPSKKLLRRNQAPKKVQFSTKPPKVHVMRVWAFAARQARAGHWEQHALDRNRFRRKIADVEMAIAWVLKPQHRSRVMFQRFMPWWNQQKRLEQAEKKKLEEEQLQTLRIEEQKKDDDLIEGKNNIVSEVVKNVIDEENETVSTEFSKIVNIQDTNEKFEVNDTNHKDLTKEIVENGISHEISATDKVHDTENVFAL